MRRIARLRRRVRRHGKKSTGTAYVISSLLLEQLDARGVLQLKRGYGVIESKLHHALDVSLNVDRSRVRHPKAALVPGLFQRLVISVANAATVQVQTKKRAGACNAISSNWASRRRTRTAARTGFHQRLRCLEVVPMKRGALFLSRILQLFAIFY